MKNELAICNVLSKDFFFQTGNEREILEITQIRNSQLPHTIKCQVRFFSPLKMNL